MQNLAIFGAGNIGKQTKKLVEEKYFDKYKLVCFVDNNPAKHGTYIGDTPIISAEKLLELYGCYVVGGGGVDCVAIALNNYHAIAEFLFQRKIIPICITPMGIYPLADDISNEERFCPICQKTSFYFGLSGLIPRQNALCPHCGSLERHRLFYLFLKEKSDFFSKRYRKMLHIAPEPCLEELFKNNVEEYISADICNPRAMVKMDITNIQYEDEVFDIIYCSHVLEHVSDDRKAMREFFRVLKKDGWAILNVPIIRNKTYEDPSIISPEEREKVFGQNDHVRAYGHDYIDRLYEAGFSVTITHAKDLLNESDMQRFGLDNGAAGEIYFCAKT